MSIQNIAHSQSNLLQEMNKLAGSAEALPVTANPLNQAASLDDHASFDGVMSQALHQVDALQQQADIRQTAVDMGQSDDLAGAMLASQQASLSFSALVQVRNKLATGFNDLMSMSI
ncbi:flagellar hook-basal body complex protein FliE [Atlantibacter sp.]|uniref:flagellar hook-basal body complex protein FliE n=1 Tax=Atlantibacter sp. TaxID=1903473 RepID=UPI0013EF75F3|nr:flagellar hook-basal body complex protein FliE [Atlantibacter sp.]